MKDKYIEERFPRYYIFGSSAKGMVDIATQYNDTFATVPLDTARAIIKDRDAVLGILILLVNALEKDNNKRFREIWF